MIDRRALLLVGGAAAVAGPALAQNGLAPNGLSLNGAWRQGGFAMGKTWPRALIFVDGEALTTASSSGLFVVGFDRDAPASTLIEARLGSRSARRPVSIASHSFPRAVVNGLPPSTVQPTDPALLARIQRESAQKQEAFASRIDGEDFKDGFAAPLDAYRISSAWGSQRVLNGTPARPHYGLDMAAPQGTVIRAPAPGTVVMASAGMHFEGGLTLIDHGQGLISCYLHQSAQTVAVGDRVYRGQGIGRIGMTGRATGPHLCWRLKWRDRNLDPSLLIGVQSPTAI